MNISCLNITSKTTGFDYAQSTCFCECIKSAERSRSQLIHMNDSPEATWLN